MKNKCYSRHSACAGAVACEGDVSKLWNKSTGDTVHLCRAHGAALQDADAKWMSAEVANAILERDCDGDVAKGNLIVAAENYAAENSNSFVPSLPNRDRYLKALYVAARELVAAENALREILR